MNKEELLVKIEQLPLFRLRDVAVKEEEEEIKEGTDAPIEENYIWVGKDKHKAVTEIGNTEPLAFVSNRYKLVQMKDVFKPILEKIENCEGDIIYYNGFGIMDIFPLDEQYVINGNRIGIVSYNSVDKTCALNIRFCIEHNKKKLTIPKKVASFRKVHLGKIGQMTQDYISVITKVKTAWTTIIDKFTSYTVLEDAVPELCESFNIDKNPMKNIKKKMMNGKTLNLWDFCMETFDYLSQREYKSDVHRRKRLDKFVQSIFDYELAIEI